MTSGIESIIVSLAAGSSGSTMFWEDM
jgi:hypothetical protein